MLRSFYFSFVIVIVALMISGCSTTPLVVKGEPVGKIRINNYSDHTLGTVGIDSCDDMFIGQGGNRLPSGVHIKPNQYFDFDVNSGCWEVIVYTLNTAYSVTGKVTVHKGEVSQYNVGAAKKSVLTEVYY